MSVMSKSEILPIFKLKFELWTKFMQAGKTSEMQKEIKRIAESGQDYYHIIFCSNNLFLTGQTKDRVTYTLEQDIDKNLAKGFSDKLNGLVFSSKNKQCSRLEHLMMRFNNHRAILCCSNKQRYEQIEQFIKFCMTGRKVMIWVDEMHMDLNMSLKYLYPIVMNDAVKKIVGISATSDMIFKKIGRQDFTIKVKPMKACDNDKYYGFNDITQRIIDVHEYDIPEYFEDKPKYISKRAIQNNGNRALSSKVVNALYLNTLLMDDKIEYDEDDVFYVPGDKYKVSHEAIKDVLLDHDFYVFVINSTGLYLHFSKFEKQKIDTKINKVHLGKLFGRLKEDYELDDKPIGITGYLSIGQGNTLCDYDTDFYITKAIFGYKTALLKDDLINSFVVQVFGRCFGNLKHRELFEDCEVFMRRKFSEEIKRGIDSGAIGEYALATGITDISWSDLPGTKRIIDKAMKEGSFDKFKEKFDIKKHATKYVPKQFNISKELIDYLRNGKINDKGKKMTKKAIFEEYLMKNRQDNLLREVLDLYENKYYIRQIYCYDDNSTKEEHKKFIKIEKCYKKNIPHRVYISGANFKKTGKVMTIIINMKDNQNEGLCYIIYSEDSRFM